MTTPAISTFAKLGIDTANPTTKGFEFVSNTLKKRQRHAYTSGIRGTRERLSTRARIASEVSSGQIVMEPTATELDILLPLMLGGTTGGGITDVAETLTEFYIQVDKVTKVYTYAACRVSKWSLTAASGQPIRLTLDIEAETETEGNAGSFPSLTPPADNIFVCSDLALTVNSVVVPFGSVTLSMDNVLDAGRHLNSVLRAEIPSLDRIVTLEVGNAPFDTVVEPLFDVAVTGFAGSLVMAGNSVTYTIGFGNLKIPAEGPDVPQRSEITLPLAMQSFGVPGGASSCKFTKT